MASEAWGNCWAIAACIWLVYSSICWCWVGMVLVRIETCIKITKHLVGMLPHCLLLTVDPPLLELGEWGVKGWGLGSGSWVGDMPRWGQISTRSLGVLLFASLAGWRWWVWCGWGGICVMHVRNYELI